MRIVEASIAVLIILGVLFSLYNKTPSSEVDLSKRAREILREISVNVTLRDAALNGNSLLLDSAIKPKIPETYLKYEVKICNLDDVCGKSEFTEGNVYAAERVIGATIDAGPNARKIRLFIWRTS